MQVAGASPERDSPRAAFALLSWRVNLAVVVALFVLSALAWRSTIQDAVSMRGMVMGLGQIGWLAQGDMSAGVFLAMWVTMMAAMMLPGIAPMVLAHLGVMRRRGRGIVPTLVFIAGYLLVWSAIGAVPLLVYKGFAPLSEDPAPAVATGAGRHDSDRRWSVSIQRVEAHLSRPLPESLRLSCVARLRRRLA